jgi:hypothetical protein
MPINDANKDKPSKYRMSRAEMLREGIPLEHLVI